RRRMHRRVGSLLESKESKVRVWIRMGCAALTLLGLSPCFLNGAEPAGNVAAPSTVSTDGRALPPLPADVVELRFQDLFVRPVGPAGLQVTDKANAAHGKRVRMLGYMVQRTQPKPWSLILSPLPVLMHDGEYGLADELPPSSVLVETSRTVSPVVPYTPGFLLLTGLFEVGHWEQPDGRIFNFRLKLDAPNEEQRRVLESVSSQRSVPAGVGASTERLSTVSQERPGSSGTPDPTLQSSSPSATNKTP
ncbi:MAG TPA: hypothetical protein VK968_09695, partial [Roseimicrobium sp.]|nr:hypothetical protein [Roseimicrobium sp.]